MGILTRFKDIMSSNINALLDKAEDPEKMIDQCLRNLNSDLDKVKVETASVMADEQRAKRALDEGAAEINKMQDFAAKAVTAGNDDDAKKFLEEKAKLAASQAGLQTAYDQAAANSTNMRAMHDKLVGDISQLDARKNQIKSKLAVAKTQDRINKIGGSVASANNTLSAFDRMEEKANKALDQANAMAELNKSPENSIDSLEDKYSVASASSVDDELAALKASMNKSV